MDYSTTDRLLALVRMALWGGDGAAEDMPTASASDWYAVFKLAQRHAITGILHPAVARLQGDAQPPYDMQLRWTAEAERIERQSVDTQAKEAELLDFFGDNGLHPTVIKGSTVAAFYPNPLLRQRGDIDLWFGPDFEAAAKAVEKINTYTQRESDGSLCYKFKGVTVEHHPHLFDLCSPSARRQMRGQELTPLNTLLLLSAHIMKHAFGRGVGLRQMCDMARAAHCLRGQAGIKDLEQLSDRLGIGRWHRMLMTCLADHLGLQGVETEHTPSALADIVMRSGNFGRGAHQDSGRMATAAIMMRQLRFSLKAAPAEAVWHILRLI